MPDTEAPGLPVPPARDVSSTAGPPPEPVSPGLKLLFRPDEIIGDGRFADNAWLLELPRPFTRLSWDNAALIAPQTAARLERIFDPDEAVRAKAAPGGTAPASVLASLAAARARVEPAAGRRRRRPAPVRRSRPRKK